jgi:NitT/TauT family transport system substrate-binding protein
MWRKSIGPALMLVSCLTCGGAGLAQSAPPLATVNIETPGQDSNALAYYALDMGFFRKHGIDAHIEAIRRGSGAAIAAAVTGQSADIGEGDIIAVAGARSHGIPLSLLAPSYLYRSDDPVTALIVAKSSSIRTAKDLDGKTIGEPSLEGPGKVATAKWLKDHGADVSTIKFVEIPQPNMGAAVARGTVAAATTNEPSLTPALEENRVLGYPYDAIGKQVELTAWFASDEWIAKNPAVAQQFIAAMREAAAWANQAPNHGRSGAILAGYSGLPPELIAKMRRSAYGEVFDLQMMQPMLDEALAQHSLATHADARSLISRYASVR